MLKKGQLSGTQIRKTLHDHTPRAISSGLDGDAHHEGGVEDQSATHALAFLYREVICFELRWTTTTNDFARLSSIHVINPEMPEIL